MALKLNLSQFVDKEVDVELRGGKTLYSTTVSISGSIHSPYVIEGETYRSDGSWEALFDHGSWEALFDRGRRLPNNKDIVNIQLSEPKPQPMIDLSKYVDNVVKVTTCHNEVYTGELRPYVTNSYVFYPEGRGTLLYYNNGVNYSSTGYNIREIEILGSDPGLSDPEQGTQQTPEKANSLEPGALSTIASALTPGAIKFVESHPEYAKVMQALIIEFVEGNLGNANGELPFMIFDRMYLAKGRD
jgi:small nuclear ribonucleoprotein (snRNP)-like protein